ncbi:predicted protein [Lichtheimia corymbifera JMRC:FSU:9682]|uniref:Uncharacterized protein n=1 Tax=Lichtheimia corymbifera JMRC:FSU:9682 TaxID=1263082 RepID=A0A068RPG1_9FUNG|nr:predicted protein [Lichtheimia corymbifera JMRC:FSU:9682]
MECRISHQLLLRSTSIFHLVGLQWKEIHEQPNGKGNDHKALSSKIIGFAMVMDGRMPSNAMLRYPGMCFGTWNTVSKDDGSRQLDTAEDDDGLDGIVEWAFIFDEGWLVAMDTIGILGSMHAAAILHHGSRMMLMVAATQNSVVDHP